MPPQDLLPRLWSKPVLAPPPQGQLWRRPPPWVWFCTWQPELYPVLHLLFLLKPSWGLVSCRSTESHLMGAPVFTELSIPLCRATSRRWVFRSLTVADKNHSCIPCDRVLGLPVCAPPAVAASEVLVILADSASLPSLEGVTPTSHSLINLSAVLVSFGLTTQLVGSQLLDRELNPGPPVVEVQSPNHWTAREVPASSVVIKLFNPFQSAVR